MPEKTCSRRTALKSLASAALAGTGIVALATDGARAERDRKRDSDRSGVSGHSPQQLSTRTRSISSGIYDATVDRIVDGEYVVVLVESNGQVVAQYDLDRDRYPALSESQRVRVFIYWGRILAIWPT